MCADLISKNPYKLRIAIILNCLKTADFYERKKELK